MGILSGLEPKAVFHYFEEICHIPHGSGNMTAMSRYCEQWAKERNLKVRRDEKGNVVIWKPAAKGYEKSEPILIQGHLDMVCEKEEGVDIDFEKQGIRLELKENIISAKGTTLGGDDGIAIAYALALLEAEDIVHPPLEVVFTVDEEIGMLGAAQLDCHALRARKMLNLDSEEEGYFLVSCAGGASVTATVPICFSVREGIPVTVCITGLQGGHSGVEIDKGRGNACRLLGRILYKLKQNLIFGISSVEGGQKDNAIPREASAMLVMEKQEDVVRLREEIHRMESVLKQELGVTDSGVRLVLEEKTDGTLLRANVWDDNSKERVITALYGLPGGVQNMSPDIENLVQTSLNLGIMQTDGEMVTFTLSVRSSVETEKEELIERIRSLIEFTGGSIEISGDYPAWEYRNDSPLRERMIGKYKELYGKEPVVQAVHAGLECGLFAGKLPGLDCVSFGPDMKEIHTPNESMDAASVRRTWEYLLAVLREEALY